MLSAEKANAIYSILVEEGGASEHARQSFVLEYTNVDPSREFRFMGHLGFGGKFRIGTDRRSNLRYYVDCYPEDRNEKRQRIMDGINSRLAAYN